VWYRPNKDVIQKQRISLEKRLSIRYKPKELNLIRILPSWKKNGSFIKEEECYFIEKRGFVKPVGRDLIGAFVERLCLKGTPRATRLVDRLKLRVCYWVNVLDMTSKETIQLGPRIFKCPETIISSLFSFYNDNDYGDFTDPKEGYNLKFRCVNPGTIGAKYKDVRLEKNPSAIPLSFLTELHDLDKIVTMVDEKEQKKILGIYDMSLVDDEEEDEKEWEDEEEMKLEDDDEEDEEEWEKRWEDEDDIPF